MKTHVLLKLSGEALAGDKGHGLDLKAVEEVGREVKSLVEAGFAPGIVIGGGNFWRGRTGTEIDRVASDQIGMLGTVMNSIYVSQVFRGMGLKTRVFCSLDMGVDVEPFKKDEAMRALDAGVVCFYAGGTGHPYFSTDMGTALRAAETECDTILMAKNVDGVYDSDPGKNPDAKKFDELEYRDFLYNGLKVIDLSAAAFLMDNGIVTKVFALKEPNAIVRAARGEKIGTLLH